MTWVSVNGITAPGSNATMFTCISWRTSIGSTKRVVVHRPCAPGIASGVNATVSRLGSLTAVAVIGLVVALVFAARAGETDAEPLTKNLSGETLSASVAGYRAGMLVAVGMAFGAAFVGALWISNREALGEREATPAAAAPAEG